MTTVTQLVDRIQLLLNDTAARVWAQTDLEEWVIDGIRSYSVHFPRTREQDFSTVAGQHPYTLATDCIAVLQVEYPADQDPAQYLTRLARTHPDFWNRAGYYDVELSHADVASPPTLYLSESPPLGVAVAVLYSAYHSPALNTVPPPTPPITVPAYHEHLIELYVIWQAHTERLATEAQEPDTTIRLVQQFKLAVQQAEYSYRTALRDAVQATAASAITGPWKSDGHDRIY